MLAAKKNAPIVLTRSSSLPEATKQITAENAMTNFVVLGGTASVPDSVVKAVAGPLAGEKIVVDPGHGGIMILELMVMMHLRRKSI